MSEIGKRFVQYAYDYRLFLRLFRLVLYLNKGSALFIGVALRLFDTVIKTVIQKHQIKADLLIAVCYLSVREAEPYVAVSDTELKAVSSRGYNADYAYNRCRTVYDSALRGSFAKLSRTKDNDLQKQLSYRN